MQICIGVFLSQKAQIQLTLQVSGVKVDLHVFFDYVKSARVHTPAQCCVWENGFMDIDFSSCVYSTGAQMAGWLFCPPSSSPVRLCLSSSSSLCHSCPCCDEASLIADFRSVWEWSHLSLFYSQVVAALLKAQRARHWSHPAPRATIPLILQVFKRCHNRLNTGIRSLGGGGGGCLLLMVKKQGERRGVGSGRNNHSLWQCQEKSQVSPLSSGLTDGKVKNQRYIEYTSHCLRFI